ncbi:MAG TPA: hypothetical protein VGF48_25765 [Thermoanaerobaculia bacterium]|jgi:hypothetical protein
MASLVDRHHNQIPGVQPFRESIRGHAERVAADEVSELSTSRSPGIPKGISHQFFDRLAAIKGAMDAADRSVHEHAKPETIIRSK